MEKGEDMDGKILVVGAAILDVLAEPVDERVFETGSSPADAITMRTGGDALNEATILAKLGESVQLLTVLGSDPASELIRAHCRKWGIGLDHTRTEPGVDTGINVVLVKKGGERSFLTNPHGTLRSLSAEHLEGDYLQGVKILCFASIFVFPKLGGRETARLFSRAKEQGILVCADMTKRKNEETVKDIREALACVDYLFPNYEEAVLVTGKRELHEIADAFLDCGVGNVVIKCGNKGCFVKNREMFFESPAVSSIRCVDTTGAGDSFAAGFVYALSQDMDLRTAAAYANVCGGLAVQRLGATEGINDIVQVENAVKKYHSP